MFDSQMVGSIVYAATICHQHAVLVSIIKCGREERYYLHCKLAAMRAADTGSRGHLGPHFWAPRGLGCFATPPETRPGAPASRDRAGNSSLCIGESFTRNIGLRFVS
jgi:hypothetical protein